MHSEHAARMAVQAAVFHAPDTRVCSSQLLPQEVILSTPRHALNLLHVI